MSKFNNDYSGDPVFVIWFKKDGIECFKTFPHNVEAATIHIEYLKTLKNKS